MTSFKHEHGNQIYTGEAVSRSVSSICLSRFFFIMFVMFSVLIGDNSSALASATGVHLNITGIPAETTEIIAVVDNINVAFRASAPPLGNSATLDIEVPADSGYRARVIAVTGTGSFPSIIAGGKTQDITVSSGSLTTAAITLTAPSLTIDPANPTFAYPGSPVTLKWSVTDPANFLDDSPDRMRLWGREGTTLPFNNYGGPGAIVLDGVGTGINGDIYSYSITFQAPATATTLYYQFGEASPFFDNESNTQAPFMILPDLNRGEATLSLRVVTSLVQTGQTTCWNTSGNNVQCSGTGQDGDIRAGSPWPNPRFTDNGNGTMKDTMSGLIWTQNTNLMASRNPSFDSDEVPGNGAVTWRHALDYVAKLNSESYLGFTDWRLPNVTELASILNSDGGAWLETNGFISAYSQSGYYWTSTSVPGSPTEAYDIYINDGDVLTYLKTSTGGYVWPVRGTSTLPATGQVSCFADDGSPLSCANGLAAGQDGAVRAGTPLPSTRIVDNGDSTFTDRVSGLTWLKNAHVMANRDPQFDSGGVAGDGDVTWQQALDYIKKLNQEAYLGYTDWRLPNTNEFLTLTDRQQPDFASWLSGQLASVVEGSTWWTSTTANTGMNSVACFYGVSDGVVGCGGYKTDAFSVWPTRGGYVQQPLTVNKVGAGTVVADYGTLEWDADYNKTATMRVAPGTTVTLTATPAPGLTFTGWFGDCGGLDSCVVTMDKAKSVVATFDVKSADPDTSFTYLPRYSNQSSGTISFSVAQAISYQCSLDGAAYTPCASPFSYSNLSNGRHSFSFLATDAVGNVSGIAPSAWTINTSLASTTQIQLPKTGQTICLDGNGLEQPCINMPGHDGAVRAGVDWPIPRFINNGDQTVTDKLTGLQWTRDANAPATGTCTGGTGMAWNDALTYITCLNSSSYLGHNDWRLPNINELYSLINVSKYQASAQTWFSEQGFINIAESIWWSSTSYPAAPEYAWGAFMTLGGTGPFEKTLYAGMVWPVRGGAPGDGIVSLPATGQTLCYDNSGTEVPCIGSGQDGELQLGLAPLAQRFVAIDNQLATDTFTGLVWARDGSVPAVGSCSDGRNGKTWSDALAYVDCLNNANYLGYSDWRMPNKYEMMSIVDRGNEPQSRLWQGGLWPATTGTTTSVLPTYWTSTSQTGPIGMAWSVTLWNGATGPDYKDNNNFVWPVRSGNLPPALVAAAEPSSVTVLPATVKKQLQITWTNPVDPLFSHVHIYRSGTAGLTGTLVADNVSGTSYLDTTVGNAQYTWWYTVRSVTTSGIESGNTAQVSGTTLDAMPPALLTGGKAVNPNIGGTLNLSWNPAYASDLAYYRIYRSTDTINYTLVHDHVSTYTYVDSGLTNGQQYYYSISAVDTSDNESALTNTSYTMSATPSASLNQPITADHAGLIQLAHTGQTTCRDAQNKPAACTANGQDGHIMSGMPLPENRFTDNKNGTITDTLTGLVWLKNANCYTPQTWSSALTLAGNLAHGACGLADGSAAGEWRLPNIHELDSLFNATYLNQADMLNNAGFAGVQANYYWSSTTAPNPAYALGVGLNVGTIDYSTGYLKGNKNYLLAVRVAPAASALIALPKTGQTACSDNSGASISCSGSGQDGELQKGVTWPATRFYDNGNESVTDLLSGLTWSKDAHAPGPAACAPAVTKTWQEGLDYIACLNSNNYLGHSDWRMPNRRELLSLVNRSQSNSATWLNSNGFNSAAMVYYWSSTSYATFNQSAWDISLYNGVAYSTPKSATSRVWPVRGDITPPVVTFTSAPLRYSNAASGTIAFTANETATFQCSLDGAAYAACTSPFSYNGLGYGQHTLAIKATDQPGNVSAPYVHSWTVNTALAASSALLLPQTRQTKCYTSTGVEITCSGTGQDGDIQAGMPWPNPRFTDNSDGTITDNLTNLAWAKDVNLMATRNPSFDQDYSTSSLGDGLVSWEHALAYVNMLNLESYLGYNNWRLPNANELLSLGSREINIDNNWLTSQGFNNEVPFYYWTSDTSTYDPSKALYVSSASFELYYRDKNVNFRVLPVRSRLYNASLVQKTGQNTCYNTSGDIISCTNTGQDGELRNGVDPPTQRFTDNGDESITDNLTGLMWSKDANAPGPYTCGAANSKVWQDALDYVKCINSNSYLGKTDWRLPNINEIASLLDRGSAISTAWLEGQGFLNVRAINYYWTSSTAWTSSITASYTRYGWQVYMLDGGIGVSNKFDALNVWPVRGGYIAPRLELTKSGTGTITASTGTLTWDATTPNKATAYYEMGANTIVTLTAVPGSGLKTAWSGCDTFSGNSCTVIMSAKKNVTATFVDAVAPSAPTGIEVQTPTLKGQLVTTWIKPADADFAHIHIYRSTVSGVLGTLVGDNLTTLKFTDSGLASQTRYYYTVRAVDAAGNESSNTAQVSGTTLDATAPLYVTGGSAGDPGTGGKLNLSWTASAASDLAYYRIYRSGDNGVSYTLAHNNVTGTSYADTGLTNGTRYYYSFTAVDAAGNESEQSTAHNLVWATPSAPDTTPPTVISCAGTITQPLPLTGDKLQLNWINPTDNDYALTRIYASTGSGLGTLIYSGTGTSYLHAGLTAGTTYKYTYRSVDSAGNETANTATCDYTPVDQTAPTCPTELAAVRNLNDTVTLSWNRSSSADIYSYQLFASAADAAVTYVTPTATALSPTVTWTTGTLTQGKTYQFGIRTVDSLLTTPNISGNCGVISVAIPNPAPACDVSTSIKVPQIGKKLGGNRTTVIAEVTSGSETNLASVRFQYRVSGIANNWLNIPSTDPANFPNPDVVKPWFVHWDITGLPDNTDYDIRAVATCTNTAQDATPNYITVAVNRTDSDSDESDNGNGEHQKTETVGGEADSNVVKGDTNDTKVTKLTLPAQSLPEGTQVTVTESNPASKAALVPSDFDNGGVFREITFSDGRHILDNNKKAELTVPYKDDDNDGIVDGTTINIHDLQVCDYDSGNNKWNCLDSSVDTTTKTVKAKTSTFSLFGLLAPPKPLSAGWNLVAVPLTPTPATATTVFGAGAFFYNPTTGAYPPADTVEPGKAYWVRNGFTAMKATGTETPDSSFSIPIQKGWNLIGNPFRYKVKVSDLQISNGSTVAMSVAESNGWTVGTLFNYSNGSYQMSTWQDGGTLDPWKGYWILSDINGTLIVPNTPAQ